MESPLTERDWKYLRRIHDEMLATLCARINKAAAEMASDSSSSPYQQYLKLYQHVQDSDHIVAECFNDWRRSTLSNRILSLRYHRLLTDEHVQGLSAEAQQWLNKVEKVLNE